MTTKPKVTLVTCQALPNLFPGEEGLLDELASRGCDPQIKVWNDPDVDWADAGMVVVRSVSDYAQDRPAFLEWTRQLHRVQNSEGRAQLEHRQALPEGTRGDGAADDSDELA